MAKQRVSHRKVVVDVSFGHTPREQKLAMALTEGVNLSGRKFDEAVEKAVRKMLERGNRS